MEPDRALASTRLDLECANDPAALASAREAVRQRLSAHGVGAAASQAVDLALEELVGNTIRYGFDDDAPHRIGVGITVHPQVLTVTLVDDARPFDPTGHPEPPAPGSLAAAPIGGMGIAMVRRSVRRWSYRRAGDTNRLELEIERGA